MKRYLLLSALAVLLLVSCTGKQDDNLLIRYYDLCRPLLHAPADSVAVALTAAGFALDSADMYVANRPTTTIEVLPRADSTGTVYSLYIFFYPAEYDQDSINTAVINGLIDHIGPEPELNRGSKCSFVCATSNPENSETILTTSFDTARTARWLDAAPSHDYYYTYYWLDAAHPISTIEQLYDYSFRFGEAQPDEASVVLSSSLRNTAFPRPRFTITISCYHNAR